MRGDVGLYPSQANEDKETPVKALINVNAGQYRAASGQGGSEVAANLSKVSNISDVNTVKVGEIWDVCVNYKI
jgi:hypothetical protein